MPLSKSPLDMELALLGLLRDRPMHAYELHRELTRAQSLGIVWHLKQSHLYALLSRLEEEGYITGHIEEQDGRPARRTLELTPEGRWALEEWLLMPVEHARDFRLKFLAKLYFAMREPRTAQCLVDQQRTTCLDWLHRLNSEQSPDRFGALVLDFRRGQVEAMLDWLDEVERSLGGMG